ncbi:MAG: peptidoglycan-binding domain-containing protein [Acidimicrobiia bacterium]|nr:peptidoglycan-binding domain-containing protein [Acidimicrobiia bacterium]
MVVRVECSGDWATVLIQPPTDAPRFVLLLRRTDAGWVEDRRCDHHDVADIAACISDLPADVVDDLARIGGTYPLGEDARDPSTWAAECAQPPLRRGDSGLCVARLQTLLVHTSGAPIVIDGYFGPATETSLIAMQTNWGLEPDGYAGTATWAALIEAAAPRP